MADEEKAEATCGIDPKKLAEWVRTAPDLRDEGADGSRSYVGRKLLEALLSERDEFKALVAALRAERFDPQRNEVTICGVRYAIEVFEHLGIAPPGEWIRIENREGETLTVRRASESDLVSVLRELVGAIRADCRRRGEMTAEVLVALDDADDVLGQASPGER